MRLFSLHIFTVISAKIPGQLSSQRCILTVYIIGFAVNATWMKYAECFAGAELQTL
jgi:hypothetical protein